MSDPLFTLEERKRKRRPTQASPRARASDLFRGRDMLVAAVFAAASAGAAYGLLPVTSGTREAEERMPGPLIRPHVVHGLSCTSCHTEAAPAKAACVTCHGPHPSTRAAHRALAKEKALSCTDCHAAHGDMQGVTFGEGDSFVRFGKGGEERGKVSVHAPASATVPLVPLTACTRCHDDKRPSDPLFGCTPAGGKLALCLDEHQAASPTPSHALDSPALSPSAVCKAQHTPSRYVAWEAAREAARVVPWVAPSAAEFEPRAPWVWTSAGVLGGAFAYLALGLLRRAGSKKKQAAAGPILPQAKVRLPQINTATCLGCYACVDACPFDVLEIERYVAVVRRPADCCGVSLCQQVCPNDSLRITEGETIEERPSVDAHLESTDARGIFLAGDLTGLPLIKNAIAQGVRAIDRIAQTLPRSRRSGLDVVIVGAGPAGIAAALQAKERGLSFAVLEQDTMAQSIKSFPRNKLVFDQPLDVPVEGALWLAESTKEELLAAWTRIVRVQKLTIHEHHRVVGIERSDTGFVVRAKTQEGEASFGAARIVLSIGRRGTPRRLEAHVSEGAEAKVSYALADARSLAGQKVLVVGLGDSAMEAAIAIARQPGAVVTMVHRGADFARGKARNIAETKELVGRGKIRIVFEAAVERVDLERVLVRSGTGREEIPCDMLLVLIGGVPSWGLLDAAGVKRVQKPSTDGR